MGIKKAFTLVEIILVMSIIAILFALTVPQLFRLRDRNTLQNAVTQLISLVRQQQVNAMNSPSLYGVHFDHARYTLFKGKQFISTDSANTVETFDYPVALTGIDVPSSQLIFASGSGEIVSFDALHHSLTLGDTVYSENKVIQFNSLGVPTSIQ